MKAFARLAILAAASFVAVTATQAQSTTNIVVTPASPIFDANDVTGVSFDAAPGFASGSFASKGVGKTDMYFTPEALFLRPVMLGEVDRISYWTKTGATHTLDPRDWYLTIYTQPYDGDCSTPTWYGDRIGTEPYFSANLADPANTWNEWSTDGAANTLRFFESTAGCPDATFGSYTDPHWDDFVGGNALSGQARADKEILFFSVQTGSAWAAGFTGQVDGLRIELLDGSVATVNFENPTPPADANACKKNGWMTATRADGSTFKNQGDCVSYLKSKKGK